MQHIQQFPHIRLFLFGWNKDPSNDGSRLPISIPPTLIFEHGVPKAVLLPEDEVAEFLGGTQAGTNSFEAEFAQAQARYLEDREAQIQATLDNHNTGVYNLDEIQNTKSSTISTLMIPEPHIVTCRRSPKDVSHPMILAAMCNPVKAPDTGDPEAVVAYFVGISEDSRVDIRYMNREQLKRFFAKRELPDREGSFRNGENGGGGNGFGDERSGATKQSAFLADCRMRTKEDEQHLSAEEHLEMLKLQVLKEQKEKDNERLKRQQLKQQQQQQKSEGSNTATARNGLTSPLRSPNNINSPLTPPSNSLFLSPSKNSGTPTSNNNTKNKSSPSSSKNNNNSSPPTNNNNNTLTGFLQRFEYTPSHHSEIVTMRWTKSYCDFERIRNSVLLEDRSRRAAERAATVDAPPTLVRRYSVTERLKTLMRNQADLIAERFNAALLQAGRSFALSQATFLFKMGFHGHVYFLWCSKMQLEKHDPSGHPGQDWIALVRRPPHTAPPLSSNSNNNNNNHTNTSNAMTDSSTSHPGPNSGFANSTTEPNNNNMEKSTTSNNNSNDEHVSQQNYFSAMMMSRRPGAAAPRYLAFGRKFLEISQEMLDRESMLRNRGLSREIGDANELANAKPCQMNDSDDDDESYSGENNNSSRKRSSSLAGSSSSTKNISSSRNSARIGGNSTNGNNINRNDEYGNGHSSGPQAGIGLMPLYSEHRIAVTQAQRHLGRALPIPLTLFTNVFRRETHQGTIASNNNNNNLNLDGSVRSASALNNTKRSTSASNSDAMMTQSFRRKAQTYSNQENSKTMELLNASKSLRANRDKMLEILKEADFSLHGRFERPKLRHAGQKHDEFNPFGKNSSKNDHPSPSSSSPSFIKDDDKASNITARLIRILGPRGRQAAQMVPQILAEIEEEERRKQEDIRLRKEEVKVKQQKQRRDYEASVHPFFSGIGGGEGDGTSFLSPTATLRKTKTEKGRGMVAFALDDDDKGNQSNIHHEDEDDLLDIVSNENTQSTFGTTRNQINFDEVIKSEKPKGAKQIAAAPSTSINRHFVGPALARSVVASWKSWVSVFLTRMKKYSESSSKPPTCQQNNEENSPRSANSSLLSPRRGGTSSNRTSRRSSSPTSSPLTKVQGWAQHSSKSVDSADAEQSNRFFSKPIAASIPLELLELHFRQLKLANNNSKNNNNNSDNAKTSSKNGTEGENEFNESEESQDSPRRKEREREELMTLPCLEFWKRKFERCNVAVFGSSAKTNQATRDDSLVEANNCENNNDERIRCCATKEARNLDKAASQHFQVDDSALHNCDVIEDDDIFCFVVPNLRSAEEICKMIHRTCVFSE